MIDIRMVSNRPTSNSEAPPPSSGKPYLADEDHDAMNSGAAPAKYVPNADNKSSDAVYAGTRPHQAESRDEGFSSGSATRRQIMPMALFHSSIFPVLCIDNSFRIIYANVSSRKFFTGFSLDGNLFFDVFGRHFQIEDVRAIRAAVLQGANGFSWRGIAHIKSRDRPTVFTRVYIFPAQMNVKSPVDFTVMFDDVTEENKRLLRSVFMSLLEASKLKDNDTGKHITRVNYYSEILAKALFNRPGYDSIDAEFIDNIGFLASMHDVGKIGTPDDILNKEGPLSDWEWTVMKEHTKNGAFILSTYPNPMAKEIALSHHEKWNGKGYPYQIESDMIPLSARIVAIADVYDALRMKRSYKEDLTHETAVEKIMETRGSHFDPSIADIFFGIAGKFKEIYEANKD